MTAQIPDRIRYRRKIYEIVGVDGADLFHPPSYNLIPSMMHTACYRGFYCLYKVKYKRLYLSELVIRAEEALYPPIEDVLPKIGSGEGIATYKGLELAIPFSGTLRIAREFISDLYIHMGFQKPSAFAVILDLLFEAAILADVVNLSEEYTAKRGAFKDNYERGDFMGRIDDAFSLNLDAD